jgi:hypothetical protein
MAGVARGGRGAITSAIMVTEALTMIKKTLTIPVS